MPPLYWTEKLLKEEIAKYTTKADFRNNSTKAYNVVKQRKLTKELLGHFPSKNEALKLKYPIAIETHLVGIYILSYKHTIVYVGKSNSSIRKRLTRHTQPNGPDYKEIDEVNVYEIRNIANRDVIELYLINKYKPRYNDLCNSSDILTIEISNLDSIIDSEYHFIKDIHGKFNKQ